MTLGSVTPGGSPKNQTISLQRRKTRREILTHEGPPGTKNNPSPRGTRGVTGKTRQSTETTDEPGFSRIAAPALLRDHMLNIQHVLEHEPEVAETSRQDKDMKDLVHSEPASARDKMVQGIEQRARGIEGTAGYQPQHSVVRQ